MRLGAYTDYEYHSLEGEISAERAFALYLRRLATAIGSLTVIGRLSPDPSRGRYVLGPQARFVALPYYPSLTDPIALVRAAAGTLRRFWRALDDLDTVWLLGPSPFALCFVALALVRRRRVVLGVRQDFPAYVRARHPDRRLLWAAAWTMEWAYRLLARFLPVVVVGPELERRYARARSCLQIAVSLVDEDDLVDPAAVASRRYDGVLRLITVGRLEAEKNPLMLADVLARLCAGEEDWRLTVYGEGPLRDDLITRFDQLGLTDRAELAGYVPLDAGLVDAYRSSHAFLHVSWTEGLPQILFEAFAAGLPVVATDVGGIREAVGGATILVEPGDPDGAALALQRIAADEALRRRLVERGHELVRRTTTTAEVTRLAAFLAHAGDAAAGARGPGR